VKAVHLKFVAKFNICLTIFTEEKVDLNKD